MKLLKVCVCVLLVTVAWQATAQEKKSAKDTKGPLPAYFGKLGLSDEDKDGLYKIQDEYKAQIESLESQLKKLKAERDSKLEEKLTANQRTRLKELRDEAAAKAAAKKSASEKPKSDGAKTEAKPAETKKP